jgi:lysophospholipase L1-like esterase
MKKKIPFQILSTLLLVVIFINAATAQSNKRSLDTLKIAYLGSSVPYGYGATNHFGYTSMFSRILQQRAADGTGKAWKTVNIAVSGDNTVKVLNRWQRDLVPQKVKYVMYALSLGNEGLHEFGKPRFDQFKANMIKLIQMARDSGYVPVVSNCYTRNDYTAADYEYIKQMDMWIHTLDVPTINLLGAVDNGIGHWTNTYWFDALHPNDAGHLEMAYTIVPSMFDALSNGKPQPVWQDNSSITWGKGKDKTDLIAFKPENTVHSFTNSITIKTNGKGRVLQLSDSSGNAGSIEITRKGFVKYTSPNKEVITGSTKINDGQWHKIVLTHYYARGETDLYCDSTQQGCASEKLVLTHLNLGSKPMRKSIMAKNWLFYRSGMNQEEVSAIAANKLLKSSLELYAPLDKNALKNTAQSTNTINWVQ